MRQNYEHYFVFDVESVGLFGPPFAVGFVVVNKEGVEVDKGGWWFDIFEATIIRMFRSSWSFTDDDIEWVKKNVLPPVQIEGYNTIDPVDGLPELLMTSWVAWQNCKNLYDDIVMVADCPFPVETNFVKTMLEVAGKANMDHSPYPFLDVASMLLARNLDPMANYDRYEDEKPVHNPLADARQSARLLMGVMGHTLRTSNNGTETVRPTEGKYDGEFA